MQYALYNTLYLHGSLSKHMHAEQNTSDISWLMFADLHVADLTTWSAASWVLSTTTRSAALVPHDRYNYGTRSIVFSPSSTLLLGRSPTFVARFTSLTFLSASTGCVLPSESWRHHFGYFAASLRRKLTLRLFRQFSSHCAIVVPHLHRTWPHICRSWSVSTLIVNNLNIVFLYINAFEIHICASCVNIQSCSFFIYCILLL